MPLPFRWSGVSGVEVGVGVLDRSLCCKEDGLTAPVIMMILPETLSSGRGGEMDWICVVVLSGVC